MSVNRGRLRLVSPQSLQTGHWLGRKAVRIRITLTGLEMTDVSRSSVSTNSCQSSCVVELVNRSCRRQTVTADGVSAPDDRQHSCVHQR